MVVRQRSSGGSADPTVPRVSSAGTRKKDTALLAQRLRERSGRVGRRIRRGKGPVLPVDDPRSVERPSRRRAWSDDGMLDSLAGALDSAEVMMDLRALPLHEHRAFSEDGLDRSSHHSRRSLSRAERSEARRSRREREKAEVKLRSGPALPLHYRLRTASRASRIGFGLAVFLLHAAVCVLLATFHTWPVARPYLKTAATEVWWTARRLSRTVSRPVESVLADLAYVREKRDRTRGEMERLHREFGSAEEADEMAFVMKALDIKSRSELERMVDLQTELQFISREAVMQRFGSGPHFVRFDLRFRPGSSSSSTSVSNDEVDDTNEDEASTSFVVRMAPLSAMPHSVHVFLEQIAQGFWNGRSFRLNPGHLVMASAPTTENGVRSPDVKVLEAAHAIAPAFLEYSEAYPHRPYTVGFVGARNAPHFFVNTKDNSEIHGPGKQDHHSDGGADPCFAEVVEGHETIRRIQEVPTKSGPWLKGKVVIESARIVSCQSAGRCEENI